MAAGWKTALISSQGPGPRNSQQPITNHSTDNWQATDLSKGQSQPVTGTAGPAQKSFDDLRETERTDEK